MVFLTTILGFQWKKKANLIPDNVSVAWNVTLNECFYVNQLTYHYNINSIIYSNIEFKIHPCYLCAYAVFARSQLYKVVPTAQKRLKKVNEC